MSESPTSETAHSQPAPHHGPGADADRHPAPPRHRTPKIVAHELPGDRLPAAAAPTTPSGRIIIRGEPPKILGVLMARLMRKRRPVQYLEFFGALLAILAIAFLMLPKSWVNESESPRPPSDFPGEAPADMQAPAPPPHPRAVGRQAATIDEWVAGVPIGAVRSSRILIDGKPCKLGDAIPPFQVRWTGKDARGRLTFVAPDGVVHTRELP